MFAHKEWVHQWIVKKAYEYLYYNANMYIPQLEQNLGVNGPGSGPWQNGTILVGAWREDEEDFIGNSGSWGGNHFWKADDGDTQTNWIPDIGTQMNAYQKVLKYAYGGWTLEYIAPGSAYGYIYKYNSLADLYKTGSLHQVGRIVVATGQTYATDIWLTATLEWRRLVVWEILGRMCHLLGDMSVPAHAHFDQHNCGFPLYDPDYFEVFFAGSTGGACNTQNASGGTNYYMNYNRNTAAASGQFSPGTV